MLQLDEVPAGGGNSEKPGRPACGGISASCSVPTRTGQCLLILQVPRFSRAVLSTGPYPSRPQAIALLPGFDVSRCQVHVGMAYLRPAVLGVRLDSLIKSVLPLGKACKQEAPRSLDTSENGVSKVKPPVSHMTPVPDSHPMN